MRRYETPTPVVISIRKPIGFREQLLGIVLLSFALSIYVSSTDYLRQLPGGVWPAVLVLALLAMRRPTASRPRAKLAAARQRAVRRSVFGLQGDGLPAKSSALANRPTGQRLWKHAVDETGAQHACKFKFAVGPLVFGPEAEAMPIIDACFSADTASEVTLRCRDIILLARDTYSNMASDCAQKRFVRAVIEAHQAMQDSNGRPKPDISDDVYRKILDGTYSPMHARLSKPISV